MLSDLNQTLSTFFAQLLDIPEEVALSKTHYNNNNNNNIHRKQTLTLHALK
jgi:hypothetical protein